MNGATVVRRGEGPTFWVLGDHVEFQTPSASASGNFAVAYTVTIPGGGPPPHFHRNEDEVFYIIEGNFEFLIGDKTVPAPPGTLIFGARNVMHQFRNKGPGRGTFLVWAQPAHFEKFISEVGTPAAGIVDPPAVAEADIERLMRKCAEYGVEIRPDAPQSGAAPARPISKPKWVLGMQVKILCTGAESNGTLTVAEIIAPPGQGPPAHLHVEQDEVFHVLEGRFEFLMGDRTVVAEAGATVHVPKQTMHYFKNVGPETGRVIDYHTPAGMEHFFNECAEPTQQVKLTPQQIAALCEKHGMKLK
jgi:mannose-6-phosphate isomerase-like protein (cupin superfamily)